MTKLEPKHIKSGNMVRITKVTYNEKANSLLFLVALTVQDSNKVEFSFSEYVKSSVLPNIIPGKYIQITTNNNSLAFNFECCTSFEIFNFRRKNGK